MTLYEVTRLLVDSAIWMAILAQQEPLTVSPTPLTVFDYGPERISPERRGA